jgi:hypothetical protein
MMSWKKRNSTLFSPSFAFSSGLSLHSNPHSHPYEKKKIKCNAGAGIDSSPPYSTIHISPSSHSHDLPLLTALFPLTRDQGDVWLQEKGYGDVM